MPMRVRLFLLACLALAASGCGLFGSRAPRENPSEVRAAIQRAHDGYVAAINTNRADRWLATLDDEVTYLVPNQPAIVSKTAVGAWVSRYLHEVTTVWTKTIVDLQVGIQADAWSVQVYADNLFDDETVRWAQRYQDFRDGMYGGSGAQPRDEVIFAFLPPPRVVGVRASYRFGEF